MKVSFIFSNWLREDYNVQQTNIYYKIETTDDNLTLGILEIYNLFKRQIDFFIRKNDYLPENLKAILIQKDIPNQLDALELIIPLSLIKSYTVESINGRLTLRYTFDMSDSKAYQQEITAIVSKF